MDGVLVDVESSWAWVHDHFGVNNDHSLEAYLNGEIDSREFVRRDVALWKGSDPSVSKADIVDRLKKAPVMKGFEESLSILNERYHTAIISGGLKPLAEQIGEKHFDRIMANDIEEKNGRLTGEAVIEVGLKNKGEAFDQLVEEMDIKPKNTAAVGNSHFDTPMLKKAGKGIAFNPCDEEVRDAGDIIIEERDLKKIIQAL